MNSDDQQALTSLLGGANGQSIQIPQNLQNMLQVFLILSVVATVIVCLYLVVSAIHKWRVQSAILRIDDNLQRLVDAQLRPVSAKEGIGEPAESLDEKLVEQK
jgi:hypothetical protein